MAHEENTKIEIDPELKPKSAIAYTLAQAILALGKDDLKRVRDNLTRVQFLLDDYEASRKGNREKT
jgi:hypothetical protein